MTIKAGDIIPSAQLSRATEAGPEPTTADAIFADRTVVLFAVPGAFTPTCSARHLPGYVEAAQRFAEHGVDEIVCLAVNDAFVMAAWGAQAGAIGKITFIADGNGAFAEQLGLTMDGTRFGMGTRAQRFAMLVRNRRVEKLFVEEPGAFGVSSAEHMLGALG